MTVSENVFKLIEESGMSQKEFSEKTGIPQSTISDWKRKNTNPNSDKILIICDVLKVSPYELLSGAREVSGRSRKPSYMVIETGSEQGILIEEYEKLDSDMQQRLLGYLRALQDLRKK